MISFDRIDTFCINNSRNDFSAVYRGGDELKLKKLLYSDVNNPFGSQLSGLMIFSNPEKSQKHLVYVE